MKIKPHLATDFYKIGHIAQYPENTELVYSNLTARSAQHAKMPPSFDGKTVFFGLQGLLQWFFIDVWNEEFFKRPKSEVVDEYQRLIGKALGDESVNTKHIEELHDLGYLPIRVDALPEGSRVNVRVPYLTVHNTNPKFAWLTNYIETVLSSELWKSITVATIAYEYRRILNKYVELTGSSKDFADWQIHDFSMRGMSGIFDASASNAGHLVAAGYGTDTIPAIDYLQRFYAGAKSAIIGGSVPATEHSVMCMGGKETEIETFRRLIQDVYPSGIVSIVSDTWDFWRVITEYAKELKPVIMSRAPNALGQAKVVFRPDSGDPVRIICGYDDDELSYTATEGIYEVIRTGVIITENERKGAVKCLWEIFGGTTNEKGYKTLDSHVGLIYGDSITLDRAEEILRRLSKNEFAADNIVFGVGSYTYQYVTRDTFGMAVKATYGIVDGLAQELEKDPKTGDGVKKSAKGLLAVFKSGNDFVLSDQRPYHELVERSPDDCLETVFVDGELKRYQTLDEIRNIVKNS